MMKREAVDLEQGITIPLADGTHLEVMPLLTIETEYPDAIRFGELLIEETIKHTVRCFVDRDGLEWHYEDQTGRTPDSQLWKYVSDRFGPESLGIEPEDPSAFLSNERLLVAVCRAMEFRERVTRECGGSWAWVMDAIDGECERLGALADVLCEDEDGGVWPAFSDGSLFVLRQLSAHPGLAGQHLGVKTLAHTISSLSRSGLGDVFMGIAYPIPGVFSPVPLEKFEPSPEHIQSLAGYYERLGFTLVRPADPDDGEPIPGYWFPAHLPTLRFAGLGEYGVAKHG